MINNKRFSEIVRLSLNESMRSLIAARDFIGGDISKARAEIEDAIKLLDCGILDRPAWTAFSTEQPAMKQDILLMAMNRITCLAEFFVCRREEPRNPSQFRSLTMYTEDGSFISLKTYLPMCWLALPEGLNTKQLRNIQMHNRIAAEADDMPI